MIIVNAYLYKISKYGNVYPTYLYNDRVEENSVDAWAKKELAIFVLMDILSKQKNLKKFN